MNRSLLFVLALGAVGCDSPGMTRKANSPTGPMMPAGNATTSSAALPGKNGPPVETSGLSVSDAIAKACGIPAGKPATPSFEFDSAALGEDDRMMLGLVAKCLTE